MLKEIIKPTRIKILLDLAITILYLVIITNIPTWGYGQIFSNLSLTKFILIIGLNLILVGIVYYPFVCGLIGIYKSIHKPFNYHHFLVSVIIVLILNPFSFYFISILFIKDNQPPIENQQTKTCGLTVISFADFSKAESSGLMVGDIVTDVDGSKINSVNDLIENSQQKQPGDMTSLDTDRGIFKVEIVRDPNNNGPVLGIKFKEIDCQ